jgi:hypothetical protein
MAWRARRDASLSSGSIPVFDASGTFVHKLVIIYLLHQGHTPTWPRLPYRLLDLHLFDPNRRNLNPMVLVASTMTVGNTFDFLKLHGMLPTIEAAILTVVVLDSDTGHIGLLVDTDQSKPANDHQALEPVITFGAPPIHELQHRLLDECDLSLDSSSATRTRPGGYGCCISTRISNGCGPGNRFLLTAYQNACI